MKKSKWLVLLGVAFILNSCEEVLERSLVDKKVTLQAPVNNLTTTDTAHNFYWEEMEGAMGYQLQIVSPRFDSIVKMVTDTAVTGNQLHLGLNKGAYQWRVRATNNSTTSGYSDAWNLTIQ
jgi:hypothetical protein